MNGYVACAIIKLYNGRPVRPAGSEGTGCGNMSMPPLPQLYTAVYLVEKKYDHFCGHICSVVFISQFKNWHFKKFDIFHAIKNYVVV